MSEIKPVYQVYRHDIKWTDVNEQEYKSFADTNDPVRILYPAAAYEALQKENASQAKRIVVLEYDVKHLKDALRAYDDEDIDDDED